MNEKTKKLTLKDILDFILENKDDLKTMDEISLLVFPYTTKYKSYYGKKNNDSY